MNSMSAEKCCLAATPKTEISFEIMSTDACIMLEYMGKFNWLTKC